jgi:Uma2 family endonuclease
MSAHAHTGRLTEEEYLKIERAAAFRSEYYDGHMYAMSGGSMPHAVVIANLTGELHAALKRTPCTVMSSDMRVRISPSRFYTYPDIVVVCGPPKVADDQNDTLLNPTILIEVLSPSTEAHDRGFKFLHYRRLESLQEFALVWQSEPRVEIFRRQPSGEWLLSEAAGLDASCRFDSAGCRIELAEIYHRIEFSSEEPAIRDLPV